MILVRRHAYQHGVIEFCGKENHFYNHRNKLQWLELEKTVIQLILIMVSDHNTVEPLNKGHTLGGVSHCVLCREVVCSSEVLNVLACGKMNIWDLEVCPL